MDDFHKESEENLNQVAEGIEKELDATNAKVDKLTKDLVINTRFILDETPARIQYSQTICSHHYRCN